MSKFPSRLKEIRLQMKFTQRQIATEIEISETQYQNYEYGKKEPTLSNFEKLCNYFNVSADYLLGLSDDPTRH